MHTVQKIPKTIFNPSIEDSNSNKMPVSSANKKNFKMNKPQLSSFNHGTSNRQKVQQKVKKSKNLKTPKDSKTSPSEFMILWPKKYKQLTRKLPTASSKRSARG